MSGFGKKSTAYICYLLVNFWWYVSCVLGIAMPLLLLYDYLTDPHPDMIFGITAPISTSIITINNPRGRAPRYSTGISSFFILMKTSGFQTFLVLPRGKPRRIL